MTPDDKLSALIERALVHLRAPLEADLHAFAHDIREQADAARASAVDEAVAASRRETQAQLDQLRNELQQARRTAEAELTDIRRLAAAEIEGARRQSASQLDEAQRQSSDVLAATRREAEEARANLALVQRELDDARDSMARAERERAALKASFEDMHHAASLAFETLGDVAARPQQILDAVRALDAADSVGDVLDRLSHVSTSYAQRAVVLMVRGSRLTSWRTVQFPGMPGADLQLEDAGLIASAVTHRLPQIHLDAAGIIAPLPAFAVDGQARDAAALPIVLGGETVAVLYADAPRAVETADRRWPLALDVVTRYAGRVIETITLQRSMGLPVMTRTRQASRETETRR